MKKWRMNVDDMESYAIKCPCGEQHKVTLYSRKAEERAKAAERAKKKRPKALNVAEYLFGPKPQAASGPS